MADQLSKMAATIIGSTFISDIGTVSSTSSAFSIVVHPVYVLPVFMLCFHENCPEKIYCNQCPYT